MIITIFAAVLLARINHYQLRWFFKSWSCLPILVTQCMVVFFQGSIFFGTYYFVRFASILQIAVILVFLCPMFVYHLYKPAVIGSFFVVLGTILNNFVVAQNGGKMPVFPTLSYLTGYARPEDFGTTDSVHILGSELTKFKFLTDYIDIGYSVLSPGDILIHLFVLIMLYAAIKAANMRYGNLHENSLHK